MVNIQPMLQTELLILLLMPLKNNDHNNQHKWSQIGLSPLSEFLEHDAVWKSLSADSNAFQHPVTPQLLQHQVGVHLTSLQHSSQPASTECMTQSLLCKL